MGLLIIIIYIIKHSTIYGTGVNEPKIECSEEQFLTTQLTQIEKPNMLVLFYAMVLF